MVSYQFGYSVQYEVVGYTIAMYFDATIVNTEKQYFAIFTSYLCAKYSSCAF